MNKNYFIFLFIYLFFFAGQLIGQQRKLWSKIDEAKISNTQLERKSNIKKYQSFHLKVSDFKSKLKNAPKKNSVLSNTRFTIEFPDKDGKMISFWVKESPVMHHDLASKFPNNKSYIGVAVENARLIIRFSVNELGLHAMLVSEDRKVQYIDPSTKDKLNYKVYAREELSMEEVTFQCFAKSYSKAEKITKSKINSANDLKLRTYRLAMAATGEYSQYHLDLSGIDQDTATGEEKKAIVLASITTAITRINSLFENDLSITLQIVANNEDIIFLDPDTDPYDNDDGSAMLGQNQTTCDANIGTSNYDIGHVLSTDGSTTQASLGTTCTTSVKARGVTGSENPTGENYYFDFIAHELGHQFGANHTFNGNSGNCGGGNRNDPTAIEPGSGSTLMAYAGLCSSQNIQQHSDLYFHAVSIDQIWTNITSGTVTCGIITDLTNNNNAPTANAGNDYIIPVSTPYRLNGSGFDADGDPITFCWEQINNEINSIPPSETDMIGTLYRSQRPSVEETRYLPLLNTVVGGNLSSKWEVTPSVSRSMDFTLTVRDNNIEGGQIATDDMKITVTDTAGPFEVTSQNFADIVWDTGTSENITWNVAGTTGNGILVNNVNILLSTDGGKTFPVVLISNTANDGAQSITVPSISAPNCRILIEAVGNIFYAVNTVSFSIGEFETNCPATPVVSTDTPKNIPDNDPAGTTSLINITDNDPVAEVKVSVEITHTWIGDVSIFLENPQGVVVQLFNGECEDIDDMNVTFDDSADLLICSSPISGTIKPTGQLSDFISSGTLGIWKLKVIDGANDDLGILESWSLEVCTSQALATNDVTLSNFNIYPNPSDGIFQISFNKNHDQVEINLFDVLGRKIKQMMFFDSNLLFDKEIDFNDLSSGLYFLQIKNGKAFTSKKIQIK